MKRILHLFFTVALACSCDIVAPDYEGADDGFSEVRFELEYEGEERAKATVADDALERLYLWIYDELTGGLVDGLVFSSYTIGSGGLRTVLRNGHNYAFFLLANTASVDAPRSLVDAHTMILRNPPSLFATGGIPMSAHLRNVSVNGDLTLTFMLRRLVSKITLMLDTGNLKHGTFTPVSVCMRQVAVDVSPFIRSSSATEVTDAPALSDADLAALKSGRPVAFYVTENCRGTLLPENTDPWNKIPKTGSDRELATYLEVRGRYSSPTIQMNDVCVRMYLGQDNVTNFDVISNTSGLVHLLLSDEGVVHGVLEETWKVEPGSYDVVGSLAFSKNLARCASIFSIPLYDSDGRSRTGAVVSDTVTVLRSSDKIDFSVNPARGSRLHVKSEGSSVMVSDASGGDVYSMDKLRIESYDHILSSEMNVVNGVMDLRIGLDASTGNMVVWSANGNPLSAKLRLSMWMLVNGSVTVFPSGTLFAGVTYTQKEESSIVFDFVPGTSPVNFDGGKVMHLLDKIYGRIMVDTYNLIAFTEVYRHRYHPNSVQLDVIAEIIEPAEFADRFLVKVTPGFLDAGGQTYIGRVDWQFRRDEKGEYIFYHPQDGRLYPLDVKESFNGVRLGGDTYGSGEICFEI